jgi:hypothetical protein
MTNMIQAQNLNHMDRFETADGVAHTVLNIRRIDHLRLRITTLEDRVIICRHTDCFHPAAD